MTIIDVWVNDGGTQSIEVEVVEWDNLYDIASGCTGIAPDGSTVDVFYSYDGDEGYILSDQDQARFRG